MEKETSVKTKHIFIIGSKGIPASYGGFESFVDKLTFYKKDTKIQYYVACMADSQEYDQTNQTFTYQDAKCFNIKVKDIGAAKAIFYDIDALKFFVSYVKEHNIKHPIFYILACRIGPFIGHYKKQIEALGGRLYVNPDGHEWKRAKWSPPVRMYWKFSEKYMVKHAHLLVCDSKNIEKYIKQEYKQYKPKTTFIAYGAETRKSLLSDQDQKLTAWYKEKNITKEDYYLVVGRFVPENNYETMIKEFMKADTKKSFVLITKITDDFYEKLKNRTGFHQDPRIKFVGTVYEQELLMKIRENAYGYFHGHEVGGTNPSLLEALGSTKLNLLLDVGFNREVAEDGAIYWNKEDGNLARLIEQADQMQQEELNQIGTLAKQRISDWYSWDYIIDQYEALWN